MPQPATVPPARETRSRPGRKNTDNPGLSRVRRRDVVENDEYAAFTRRIVRAHARRVAAGDVEALSDMVRLIADVESAITEAVDGLRIKAPLTLGYWQQHRELWF